MINLTPHTINVINDDGEEFSFPPSGNIARVATVQNVIGICAVTGANILKTEYGEVENLPNDDSPVLVSLMVLERTDRKNTFAPDTGKTAIRNDAGQIVAVRNLISK